MKTRIVVGFVLALFLVAILVLGGYVLLTALSLISLCAVFEVSRTFRNHGMHPVSIPVYCFAFSFGFVYLWFDLPFVFALYCLCLVTSVLWLILSKDNTSADAIPTIFLLFYPTLLLVCVTLVYFRFERPIALTATCLAFAAPSCADMFAYFGGTLFGKHKLCPRISPKKTVAGAWFALLGSVFFSVILIFGQRLWSGSVPAAAILLLGVLLGIVSQTGDLLASMIKRWAEVKDFSSLFPGHGGVMDRIDSILLCAPIVLSFFIILEKFRVY